MNNRVIKIDASKKDVMDRVCRSALVNCTDEEWHRVIDVAQEAGVLPEELFLTDIANFNERASKFGGTVKQFIAREARQ
jgi:hypothetical protein